MTEFQSGSTPEPADSATGTAGPGTAVIGGAMGTGGSQEWLLDLAALGFTAVLVAAIVLIRRWLLIRSRRPLPGLPPEPVLPFSRHGTLHDPKYLGRMLEAEGKSKDP